MDMIYMWLTLGLYVISIIGIEYLKEKEKEK